MPLHPDAAAALEFLDSLGQPPIESQDPASARAARATLILPSSIAVGALRDLDAGGVPARLYRPTADAAAGEVTGLTIWLHGGGWVLGSVAGHDDLCRDLCQRSGHAVLSVEYRLAPEDPFPAGLTDALTALRWAYEQAEELRVDRGRFAVAGDSAGANLAAVVAQLAPVPLHRQVLLYPVTDARADSPSYRENADGRFLTASGMRWFIDHYLSGGHGSPDDPRVSPLLASDEALAASPPTLVVTAELDPLRDEGIAYAERLAACGVPTSHTLFHGQIHGFASVPLIGDAALARAMVGEFLRRGDDLPTPPLG